MIKLLPYILFEKYSYLYFSIGNGQYTTRALCWLYRRTFVPYKAQAEYSRVYKRRVCGFLPVGSVAKSRENVGMNAERFRLDLPDASANNCPASSTHARSWLISVQVSAVADGPARRAASHTWTVTVVHRAIDLQLKKISTG